MLDVPPGITLTDVLPPGADPRLKELQDLTNWLKIYGFRSQQLIEELWEDAEPRRTVDNGGVSDRALLERVTGMSRYGLRKRADRELAAAVLERRRLKNRQEPEGTP